MSYKIKSFIYLSCFIAAFTIYDYSITEAGDAQGESPEIAIAELDKVEKMNDLPTESPE